MAEERAVAVPLVEMRLCGASPYGEVLYADDTHVLARWITGFASQPPETQLFRREDCLIVERGEACRVGAAVQSAFRTASFGREITESKLSARLGELRGDVQASPGGRADG